MNDEHLEENKNLEEVLRAITMFGITAIASTALDNPLPLYLGIGYVGANTLDNTYRLYKHYRYIKGAKDNLKLKK